MIADFAGRPPRFSESSNAFIAVAAKARSSSDALLIGAEVAGLAAAIGVMAWQPKRIDVALGLVAIGALGLWGITEHALAAQGRRANFLLRYLLVAFSRIVATASIVAAVAAGYVVIGEMMGVFIL